MKSFETVLKGAKQALTELHELEQGECGLLVWGKLRSTTSALESVLLEGETLQAQELLEGQREDAQTCLDSYADLGEHLIEAIRLLGLNAMGIDTDATRREALDELAMGLECLKTGGKIAAQQLATGEQGAAQ